MDADLRRLAKALGPVLPWPLAGSQWYSGADLDPVVCRISAGRDCHYLTSVYGHRACPDECPLGWYPDITDGPTLGGIRGWICDQAEASVVYVRERQISGGPVLVECVVDGMRQVDGRRQGEVATGPTYAHAVARLALAVAGVKL